MITCLVAAAACILAAQPAEVRDPQGRREFLALAFPGAAIRAGGELPERQLRPGVFAEQRSFRVIRNAEEAELGHAEDVTAAAEPSSTRRLWWKIYAVGPKLAVGLAHYEFLGVKHALCCPFFTRLFRFERGRTGWTASRTEESLTYRASGFPALRFADVDGDGQVEALVESAASAAGFTAFRWLRVYSLARGLDLWFDNSLVEDFGPGMDRFRREIDLDLTRKAAGRVLHVRKIVEIRGGKTLHPPEVTREEILRHKP